MTKNDSKDVYTFTKDLFQINAVLLYLLFLKNPEKTVSTNILNSTTVLNTDDTKCFLSTSGSLKDHVTLKTEVIMHTFNFTSQE